MVPKIKVEWESPGYRKYHTGSEISQCSYYQTRRPFPRELGVDPKKQIGEKGVALLSEVVKLEGVAEVTLSPYCLSVEIGRAFNWEEIDPQIIKALKETFGDEKDKVEVIYSGILALKAPKKGKKGFLRKLLLLPER